MTIAIGEPFRFGPIKGALVCADSKIVSSDLATTFGSKIHLSLTPRKSAFAIADAAEDGDAAKMLANEITSALCDESVVHMGLVNKVVKKQMTQWYAAYSGARPPSTQFALAAAVGGECSLFYCSPPNTVLMRPFAFAIGQGARVVDPLLPGEASPSPNVKEAILRAAYWMHRAKRDEGSMCGGGTSMFLISDRGGIGLLHGELDAAESLAEEVDSLVSDFTHGILSLETEQEQNDKLRVFSERYMKLDQHAKSIKFSGLTLLDGKWSKPKSKNRKPVSGLEKTIETVRHAILEECEDECENTADGEKTIG